jgi:hypothetical protein
MLHSPMRARTVAMHFKHFVHFLFSTPSFSRCVSFPRGFALCFELFEKFRL